ncbi:MAG TPA: DUF72 domain-containing protein [Sphingobacteriaceae bacterium]
MKWWIGCSGFYYRHWKEVFYPKGLPQKKWFEFYCEHFNTVELNVTFYRFPKLGFLQDWYDRSPDNFRFAVKVPRRVTHFRQFHDAGDIISQFYSTVGEGLKEKLGCVLFQMPPRMSYTGERLERILNSLDGTFRNVLEFRHESWWNGDVYRALAAANVTFCGMSHPALPDDIIQNTSTLYYRFHGETELYKSLYDRPHLKKFVSEVGESKTTREAFIYFNNDINASAITNGRQMQALV